MWSELLKTFGVIYLLGTVATAAIIVPILPRKSCDDDKHESLGLRLLFSLERLLLVLVWPILLLFVWTRKPQQEPEL